jgi:Amt family ammonium transporter
VGRAEGRSWRYRLAAGCGAAGDVHDPVGALPTGVFASLAINPAGPAGGIAQLGKQAVAVGVTLTFSSCATWLIPKVTDVLVGLRASEDDEEAGLDLS